MGPGPLLYSLPAHYSAGGARDGQPEVGPGHAWCQGREARGKPWSLPAARDGRPEVGPGHARCQGRAARGGPWSAPPGARDGRPEVGPGHARCQGPAARGGPWSPPCGQGPGPLLQVPGREARARPIGAEFDDEAARRSRAPCCMTCNLVLMGFCGCGRTAVVCRKSPMLPFWNERIPKQTECPRLRGSAPELGGAIFGRRQHLSADRGEHCRRHGILMALEGLQAFARRSVESLTVPSPDAVSTSWPSGENAAESRHLMALEGMQALARSSDFGGVIPGRRLRLLAVRGESCKRHAILVALEGLQALLEAAHQSLAVPSPDAVAPSGHPGRTPRKPRQPPGPRRLQALARSRAPEFCGASLGRRQPLLAVRGGRRELTELRWPSKVGKSPEAAFQSLAVLSLGAVSNPATSS